MLGEFKSPQGDISGLVARTIGRFQLKRLRDDYCDIVPAREAYIGQNTKEIKELDKALTRRFEQEGDFEKAEAELRDVIQKLGASSDSNKLTREDLNEFAAKKRDPRIQVTRALRPGASLGDLTGPQLIPPSGYREGQPLRRLIDSFQVTSSESQPARPSSSTPADGDPRSTSAGDISHT